MNSQDVKTFGNIETLKLNGCRPRPLEPLEKCVVRLTYFFKTKTRHDVDNYIKFLLDGLVHAKIIKDDSFDCIKLELEGDYDKVNPRVEILIYEQ